MTQTVKIPLFTPLVGHSGPITEVILKEPDFDTYLELGDPVTIARAPDGSIFTVENNVVIRAYIERCLVAPKDPIILEAGGFRLARQLRDAVLGFFRAGPSEAEASKTSATTSSSAPEKDASTPDQSAA